MDLVETRDERDDERRRGRQRNQLGDRRPRDDGLDDLEGAVDPGRAPDQLLVGAKELHSTSVPRIPWGSYASCFHFARR